MKKKVVIAVVLLIIIVGLAATFVVFQMSKDTPAVPVIPVVKNDNEQALTPGQNILETPYAYRVYKFENDFIYIDAELESPNHIWVVGYYGVIEAEFIEKENRSYDLCDHGLERPFKKYAVKNNAELIANVAFPKPNVKIELIESDFTRSDLPENMISWAKENFENPSYKLEVGAKPNEYDPVKACEYKSSGTELEIVKCGSKEIVLWNKKEIGDSSEENKVPFAFTYVGDKKYVMYNYKQNDERKIGIESENETIIVRETDYSGYCKLEEPKHYYDDEE